MCWRSGPCGGAANDGRAMGSFIQECIRAVPGRGPGPVPAVDSGDSAGYQEQVIAAAERHDADFTVTTRGSRYVLRGACPGRRSGHGMDHGHGSRDQRRRPIAETTATLLGRRLRLIVRRQPKACGEQLAFDDLDGWRLHAIITNVDPDRLSAAEVQAHHRLRGGIPEDTIRALKNDFGMNHAPVQPFFGNWLYWQAVALAHNVGVWLRTLALPPTYRRARGKRLRLGFLNVAAPAGPPRPAAAPAPRRRLPPPAGVHQRPQPTTHPARVRLTPADPPRPPPPTSSDHARPELVTAHANDDPPCPSSRASTNANATEPTSHATLDPSTGNQHRNQTAATPG